MTHSGKFAHPAVLYLLSDSVGETAEVVTKAACSQFDAGHVELRRMPYLLLFIKWRKPCRKLQPLPTPP